MNDLHPPPKHRQHERGNVLWFILIALVLIGLLTAVVTRSGSTVEQTGDVEQTSIVMSQILRFASGVEATITNMKLQGISENQISFQDSATGATYTNANCTGTACRVFHVQGGGISYQDPPTAAGSATEWTFTGTNSVDGIGSASADLVMILQNISQDLCNQLNRASGLTYADDADLDFTAFQGTFADNETFDAASRRASGCLGDSGSPFFYYVLLPR